MSNAAPGFAGKTIITTVADVLSREQPVLYALHEERSGGNWRFFTDDYFAAHAFANGRARLIKFDKLAEVDNGLHQLADLPPGWEARRTHVGAEWQRQERPVHTRIDEHATILDISKQAMRDLRTLDAGAVISSIAVVVWNPASVWFYVWPFSAVAAAIVMNGIEVLSYFHHKKAIERLTRIET